jgi:hypothetical protein
MTLRMSVSGCANDHVGPTLFGARRRYCFIVAGLIQGRRYSSSSLKVQWRQMMSGQPSLPRLDADVGEESVA